MSDADKGPMEFCIHNTHESHYCGSCRRDAYLALQKELEAARDRFDEANLNASKVIMDQRQQLADANKKIEELNHLYKQAVEGNKWLSEDCRKVCQTLEKISYALNQATIALAKIEEVDRMRYAVPWTYAEYSQKTLNNIKTYLE